MLQTRFDLSFQIIKSATEVAPFLEDTMIASTWVKSINRAIRKARDEHHFVSFGRIGGFGPLKRRSYMCGIRAFAFSDAGYAAMRGGRSVESSVIICGGEVSRDGTTRCLGSTIDTYTRRISRCARSTLAAEAVACANTVGLSIWHRACVTELLLGCVIDTGDPPTNPFALRNPFREDDEIESGETLPELDSNGAIDHKVCLGTQTPQFYNRDTQGLISDGAIYETDLVKPDGPMRNDLSVTNRFDVQIIALVDAANVYIATISQQPRTVDKLTKITPPFIRDLSAAVAFSFLDSHYSIADSGTKFHADTQIFLKLFRQRVFEISSVGRRESRISGNLLQLGS